MSEWAASGGVRLRKMPTLLNYAELGGEKGQGRTIKKKTKRPTRPTRPGFLLECAQNVLDALAKSAARSDVVVPRPTEEAPAEEAPAPAPAEEAPAEEAPAPAPAEEAQQHPRAGALTNLEQAMKESGDPPPGWRKLTDNGKPKGYRCFNPRGNKQPSLPRAWAAYEAEKARQDRRFALGALHYSDP